METIRLQADTVATQDRTIETQNKYIEKLTKPNFSVVSSNHTSLSPYAVAYEAVRRCLQEDNDYLEEKSKIIVIIGLEQKETHSITATDAEVLVANLVKKLDIKELSDAFNKEQIKL